MTRLLFSLLAVLLAHPAWAVVDAVPPRPDLAEPLAAARTLFQTRGQSAEAQQAFEKIVAIDPQNAEALNYLARLALRRGDAEKAVSYAEKAAALAPDHADIQHTLGDAHGLSAQQASLFSQLGFAKKSLAAYRRAVALAPGNVEFHLSLFNYYRQAPGIAGGGFDQAAQEAVAIKQLDPLAGHRAFAALYASNKKYDQALAEFDEVLQSSPNDYSALYQIGRLAATTGQFLDRGLASLRRCLELTPGRNDPTHANAQWRLGLILERKPDLAGARAAYAAALQLDPKFTPAADSLQKLN